MKCILTILIALCLQTHTSLASNRFNYYGGVGNYLIYSGLANSCLNMPSPLADSLQSKIIKLPHDSIRLKTMEKQVVTQQSSPEYMDYVKSMFKEAEAQKNDRYICHSAYYQLSYYYNQNQTDSVYKWANYLKPIAGRIQYWLMYFNAQKLLINTYIYNGEYEYAINEAQLMQQKAEQLRNVDGLIAAYECLVNAYHETSRRKEEGIILQKAYKLFPKFKHENDKVIVLCQFIEYYKSLNNYRMLKTYLDKNMDLLNSIIKKEPDMYEAQYDNYLYLDIHYIHYYTNIQKADSARKYIQKARLYINKQSYLPYLSMFQDACAQYYKKEKDYSAALMHADSAISVMQEYGSMQMEYAKELISKAEILQKMGDYKKALLLYKEANYLQDSITAAISATQLEEIKSMHNLDNLVWEEGKIRNRIQFIILFTIGITLILCIVYITRINRIRRALEISEQETLKATRILEKTNEAKNRFLVNISHAIRVPLNGIVGFCQILATETNIEKSIRKEYAGIIQQNTDKLMRLVNNVLDLSRLEAGMMKFQLKDDDIVQLCADTINVAKMRNPDLQINFHCSLKEYIVQLDGSWMMKLVMSTLTPLFSSTKEERNIEFTLDKKGEILRFRITNSYLADPQFSGQESDIQNSINRLLLEHFGGTYQIVEEVEEGSVILFTYPTTFTK